jgi:tetratricopeptide (TPR) repeat protein
MVAHPPFGSSSFRLVAKGLVELHRLITADKNDSPEAEAVRDALDAPLKALNPTEKARAQWLSEDLYSASSEPNAGIVQKQMTPQAQRQLNEALQARQNREWDKALELLRQWEEYVLPAQLSYLRGSVWFEAGSFTVAAAFYQHASECDPENANYKAIYMHSLEKSHPPSAGKIAKEVLANEENWAPVVVARAADIRIHETRDTSDAESAKVRRELVGTLERNLARLEQDQHAASRTSAYAMTAGLLGFCHEFLENSGAAVTYYSRGLQVKPNEDGLLVARGILLYGTSPRAITDLERAARLGSPVVWPYLFLAHHYLATSRFEQSRAMCETGLKMHASDTAKSQLEEWRAIAQAELGFPPDAVRAAFETAVRLDPSNELAKRNQDAFEASLRVPHARPHSIWEQESEATVRQFGLAERRYSFAA